jgi:hypothetical protein
MVIGISKIPMTIDAFGKLAIESDKYTASEYTKKADHLMAQKG